jgi:hypothetical protein
MVGRREFITLLGSAGGGRSVGITTGLRRNTNLRYRAQYSGFFLNSFFGIIP